MVNFLLFIFATIGLAHILVDSALISPIRDWIKDSMPKYGIVAEKVASFLTGILSCYQCCGMWTGLLCGYLCLTHDVLLVLTCGFAGSFLAYFAALIVSFIETLTMYFADPRK